MQLDTKKLLQHINIIAISATALVLVAYVIAETLTMQRDGDLYILSGLLIGFVVGGYWAIGYFKESMDSTLILGLSLQIAALLLLGIHMVLDIAFAYKATGICYFLVGVGLLLFGPKQKEKFNEFN